MAIGNAEKQAFKTENNIIMQIKLLVVMRVSSDPRMLEFEWPLPGTWNWNSNIKHFPFSCWQKKAHNVIQKILKFDSHFSSHLKALECSFSHSMMPMSENVLWFLPPPVLFHVWARQHEERHNSRKVHSLVIAASMVNEKLKNVYEFVFNGNIASYHFGWAQVVTISHSVVKKMLKRNSEILRFTFTSSTHHKPKKEHTTWW